MYSYLHVRLRQYVESIAFCDGEEEEKVRATKSLETLLTYQRTIVNKELPLKCKCNRILYIIHLINPLSPLPSGQ